MSLSTKSLRVKIHPFNYVLLCASTAIFFGFSIGEVYACKFDLMKRFMLDNQEVDNILITFLLGAVAGVFLGGRVTYDTGRRFTIVGSFLLGAIAHSALLLSPAFSAYLIAQFVQGSAFGVYIISSLLYVSEIATQESRGKSTMCVCLMLTIGIEISIFVGNLCYMHLYGAVISILVLSFLLGIICFLRLPESPRWLAVTGFTDAALSELFILRKNTSIAARELADINECARGSDKGIALFLHSGSYRRTIWFLFFVTVLIYFSGYAFFPYISIQLVTEVQRRYYSLNNELLYNYDFLKSGITIVLLGAITATFTVDKIGRKKLMLGCIFVTELVLVLMYFLIFLGGNFGIMFLDTLVLVFIYAASIAMFVFFSTIVTELLPTQGRELGISLIFFINFVGLMSSMMLFEMLVQRLSLSGFFALNLLFGALLFAFVYHSLQELKGKTLEFLELNYLRGN